MIGVNELRVERARSGYIVCELGRGLQVNKWAFETPQKLAAFICDWANVAVSPENKKAPEGASTN